MDDLEQLIRDKGWDRDRRQDLVGKVIKVRTISNGILNLKVLDTGSCGRHVMWDNQKNCYYGSIDDNDVFTEMGYIETIGEQLNRNI